MHTSALFLLAMSALTASAAPAPAPGFDHKVDGYAQHREKEPERYNFRPEYYDEGRYRRTPNYPPHGKDFVYYDGGYDGGKDGGYGGGYGGGKGGGYGGKDGGKGREREEEFRKVEKKERKYDKDRFAKNFEEAEEERFKKASEREEEEEARKFEECDKCRSEEVLDEQCCFEEGFGFDKGIKYDKAYGYYRDLNKKFREDEHRKDKQAAKKDWFHCEEEEASAKFAEAEAAKKCEKCDVEEKKDKEWKEKEKKEKERKEREKKGKEDHWGGGEKNKRGYFVEYY